MTGHVGTCAVLITNNGTQRSLCANLAAANHFTVDHINQNKKIVQNVDFVYVSVSTKILTLDIAFVRPLRSNLL